MAKFKVNKKFKDVHTGKVYEAGDVIELAAERVKEVGVNLGDDRLTAVETEPVEAPVETPAKAPVKKPATRTTRAKTTAKK